MNLIHTLFEGVLKSDILLLNLILNIYKQEKKFKNNITPIYINLQIFYGKIKTRDSKFTMLHKILM